MESEQGLISLPKELHIDIYNFSYNNDVNYIPISNQSLITVNKYFHKLLLQKSIENLYLSLEITPTNIGLPYWNKINESSNIPFSEMSFLADVSGRYIIENQELFNSQKEISLEIFKNIKDLTISDSRINIAMFSSINTWGKKLKSISIDQSFFYKLGNKKCKSLKKQKANIKKIPNYSTTPAINLFFYKIKNIPIKKLSLDNLNLHPKSFELICSIETLKELSIYNCKNFHLQLLTNHIENLKSLKSISIDLNGRNFNDILDFLLCIKEKLTIKSLRLINLDIDHINGVPNNEVEYFYNLIFSISKTLILDDCCFDYDFLILSNIDEINLKSLTLIYTYLPSNILEIIYPKISSSLIEASEYNGNELTLAPEFENFIFTLIENILKFKKKIALSRNMFITDLSMYPISAKSLTIIECPNIEILSILNLIDINTTLQSIYIYDSLKLDDDPFIEFIDILIKFLDTTNNTTLEKIVFKNSSIQISTDLVTKLRAFCRNTSPMIQIKPILHGLSIYIHKKTTIIESDLNILDLSNLPAEVQILQLSDCPNLNPHSFLNFITQNTALKEIHIKDSISIESHQFIPFVSNLLLTIILQQNSKLEKIFFTHKNIPKNFNILDYSGFNHKYVLDFIKMMPTDNGFCLSIYPDLNRKDTADKVFSWTQLDDLKINIQNIDIEDLVKIFKVINFFPLYHLEIASINYENLSNYPIDRVNLLMKLIFMASKKLTIKNPIIFEHINHNPISIFENIYCQYITIDNSWISTQALQIGEKLPFNAIVDTSFEHITTNSITPTFYGEINKWYKFLSCLSIPQLLIKYPDIVLHSNDWSFRAKSISMHNLSLNNKDSIIRFLNFDHDTRKFFLYFERQIDSDESIFYENLASFIRSIDELCYSNKYISINLIFTISPDEYIEYENCLIECSTLNYNLLSQNKDKSIIWISSTLNALNEVEYQPSLLNQNRSIEELIELFTSLSV